MPLPKSFTTVTPLSKTLALILFILLPFMGFYAGMKFQQSMEPTGEFPRPIQQACTQEAKICPDGSAVGRTGPQCEFSPCPSPKIIHVTVKPH